MARILLIGAGGVANVIAVKAAQQPDTFSSLCIASRTLEKCEKIAERVNVDFPVTTAQIDASDRAAITGLIRSEAASIVINAALPEQNLPIMDACLEAGAHYIDTSAPEPVPGAYELFAYRWQLAYHDRFKAAGLTALLSIGFDPGVTNAFAAHLAGTFDQIQSIDIIDYNGGSHHLPFATNFNPVTNLQEVTQPSLWWEGGQWNEEPAFNTSKSFVLPELGLCRLTRLYHEELETLVARIGGLERAQFWMGLSEDYLQHIRVLSETGLLSMDAVEHEGISIVPLEFLSKTLPDPATLGPDYIGKTNIGCLARGIKDGRKATRYLYNLCDHREAFLETGSHAVSYTAGVPPVVAAELLLSPHTDWNKPGVWVPEDLPTAPLLSRLANRGLPWEIVDGDCLLP
jgi:saccharopine dehydrogenase (NAD+, L-lysine-forming)